MRIVLIKIVRFLEDGLEPPLTYDEANKRLLHPNLDSDFMIGLGYDLMAL